MSPCRPDRSRRRLLALGMLPLARIAPAADSVPRVANLVVGINALWLPGDAASLRARFRKARALGIREVRLDWEWRQVEVQRNTYVWDKLDTLVRTAYEEGVALLPIVHYAPAWALVSGGKADDVYEMAPRNDSFDAYGQFLLACVGRYGPGGNASVPFTPIVHWQVWNEPNLPQFWGPRPDPKAFSNLMRTVWEVMAPVRSQILIVHAGLSKNDVEFMWHLWDANPQYQVTFDILAVHPYLFDWKDGIRAPEAMDGDDEKAAPMGFIGSLKDPGYLGKVFNLQLFMQLRGARDKPIWITELGYFVSKHRLGVNEAQQAERLRLSMDFIRERLTTKPYGVDKRALMANVQRVYWFSLEDYPSPDGLGSFGVYRPDGSLRPAAGALRRYVR